MYLYSQNEVKEKLKATTKEIDKMSDDYEAEIERLKDTIKGHSVHQS